MEREVWNKEKYEGYWRARTAEGEDGFRAFHGKIVCANQPIIGIRTPQMRKLAKEIGNGDGAGYLAIATKETYEQRLMYGLVLSQMKMPYEEFIVYCDTYVRTFVDNWALCDVFTSSIKTVVLKNKDAFYSHIQGYLADESPWVVRVGIVLLLEYYIDEVYLEQVLGCMDKVQSDFYYVRMAKAWLLSLVWVKFPERARAYAQTMDCDFDTTKMFIQKCCDSYRISPEDKVWLRAWRKQLKRGL